MNSTITRGCAHQLRTNKYLKQYQGIKNGPGIDPVYMFNQLRTMAKLPEGDHIWIIEDPIWYDGFFCYEDQNTGQRYSKVAHLPLEKDEMCKYGKIYKVEQVKTGPREYDYYYKILSERPDEDEGGGDS